MSSANWSDVFGGSRPTEGNVSWDPSARHRDRSSGGPSTSAGSLVVDDDYDMDTTTTLLNRFNLFYQDVHGYLSIVVCTFGICSNVINVVVLTRKSMITPTNCLLTAITVADLLTMTSYLPYSAYFYCYGVLDSRFGHAR